MTAGSPREPVDQAARSQALDPLGSYCVSAPAGSGKTALLVRRFLALLARCREPEQVVAITFTRKAAAEMRGRVLRALTDRSTPTADNRQDVELWELAQAVREQDQARGWGLEVIPGRLAIRTIDSFCAELTRQLPVLSGAGGPLKTTDQAQDLYRQAVDNFFDRQLRDGGAASQDLQRLLLHLDNRWDTAQELLAALLSRREQWQPVLGGQGFEGHERAGLQAVTAAIVDDALEGLRQSLAFCRGALEELLEYRAANLAVPSRFCWDEDDLAGWRELQEALLTQSGAWRKSVNKTSGFPAGKGQADDHRTAMADLLAELKARDDGPLLATLQRLSVLPDRRGDPRHWEVLVSLTRLLPRLSAELLLVFARSGEVDHAQVALGALAALGPDDNPTDTALRLDYRIEHLLVDEFQDTSSLQFELVRRLTRGWREHNESDPDNPRTLFLVGDAMQSIYGFREANVGLFIRAREAGIGDLTLTPLDLTVNFRSARGLVDWTNETFKTVFPGTDDAQTGAVRFREARGWREGNDGAELRLFTGDGGAEGEVAALCDRLKSGLADDSVSSMAILVRSRNHLPAILAALRERQLPFAGQDLEPLSRRPVIRDLMTLCSVLSDPLDRLAFLSLLRCPGVALDNRDLLQVSLKLPVARALDGANILELNLSATGTERLTHVQATLAWAAKHRHRLALRVWVEECWLRFGGAASLESDGDASDAEQFFLLLESLEPQGLELNRVNLERAMDSLYAAPAAEGSKLQVMTLHKAKGLEFDEVFIPSLAKSPANQDRALLLWDEINLADGAPGFLMDIRAGTEKPEAPQPYDYLFARAREKRHLESDRLFYVGCTRAASYLWLSATLPWDEKKEQLRAPPSASLLGGIWPVVCDQCTVSHVFARADDEEAAPLRYLRLRKLPDMASADPAGFAHTGVPVDSRHARALGTAIHRCLESLVYRPSLPAEVDDTLGQLLRIGLLEAGTAIDALEAQWARGREALEQALQEDRVRWMLSPDRPYRRAELPLTLVDGDEVKQLVLDYVFVDEARQERWVVDYKTAMPREDESREAFLEAQCATYEPQLRGYRRALEGCFSEPVRCALYFTALAEFCEVPLA